MKPVINNQNFELLSKSRKHVNISQEIVQEYATKVKKQVHGNRKCAFKSREFEGEVPFGIFLFRS